MQDPLFAPCETIWEYDGRQNYALGDKLEKTKTCRENCNPIIQVGIETDLRKNLLPIRETVCGFDRIEGLRQGRA